MLSLSAAALGAWKIIIISYRRTCLVFNLGNLTYCLSQSQAYNSQDFSSHYFCQNTNQQNCPLVPTQKFTSRTSMSHQTDSGNLNKVWGVHPQCYIHCISLFEMQPICQAFWSWHRWTNILFNSGVSIILSSPKGTKLHLWFIHFRTSSEGAYI